MVVNPDEIMIVYEQLYGKAMLFTSFYSKNTNVTKVNVMVIVYEPTDWCPPY